MRASARNQLLYVQGNVICTRCLRGAAPYLECHGMCHKGVCLLLLVVVVVGMVVMLIVLQLVFVWVLCLSSGQQQRGDPRESFEQCWFSACSEPQAAERQ